MKGEEVQQLVYKKLKEDKDYPEIYEEIESLKQSQVIFKEQEKEMNELKRKLFYSEKENKELKDRLFKQGLIIEAKKDEKREVLKENGDGSISYLRRIMLIMSEDKKKMCLTDISRNCLISPKVVLSCIGFLEDYKLLKMEKDEKNIQRWFIC